MAKSMMAPSRKSSKGPQQDAHSKTARIAVFGKTGTGKTSFIKSVTGADIKVGHELESSEFCYTVARSICCLSDLNSYERSCSISLQDR